MRKLASRTLLLCLSISLSLVSRSGPQAEAAAVATARTEPAAQLSPVPLGPTARTGIPGRRSEVKTASDYGRMGLRFIRNENQLEGPAAYYVSGRDKSIFFRPDGLTFVLNAPAGPRHRQPQGPAETERRPTAEPRVKSWSVAADFVGAREGLRPEGADKTDGIISYFKGRPEEWKTGIPTYAKVVYPEVWPGIDLAYSGTVNQLKYEFVIEPGADPALIRIALRGAADIREVEGGGLEVVTPVGSFRDGAPVAYQEIDGRRVPVSVAYALSEDRGRGDAAPAGSGTPAKISYGFSVGDYDHGRPLVLDPVVFVYCGFIGGDAETEAHDIVVDSSGNAYITGLTWASGGTFPVTVGPDLTSSSPDAFVAKLNAAGTGYVYCGFIGGTGSDQGDGIALDAAGNAYVAGTTDSSAATFPVVTGPDPTLNGQGDAFVAKVNASGTALVYCGYIGGSGDDWGYDIGVDGSGNAYVTGYTNSTQTTFPETIGPDLTHNGGYDAFIAKVNAAGSALSYCGYLGGSSTEYGYGIAVGTTGNAYIAGYTSSTETTFPKTIGPDLTQNGSADGFVAKVTTAGALSYCGFLGGADADWCEDIAIDGSENAYLTGKTYSTAATFPLAVGPDLTHNGFADAFAIKVNAAGTAILYAGYIGGAEYEAGYNIAVDTRGNAYIAGYTESNETTFPVRSGPDLIFGGTADGFVAKIDASGSALAYCGYIGGPVYDEGWGVAVDTAGSAYVVGYAYSNEPGFPVHIGPDLTHNAVGYKDGYVAKVVEEPLWKPHHAVGDFDDDGADEAAVDFGGAGAWLYDNGSWTLLTAVNPESLMAADVDGDSMPEVIADFAFTGLWLWNGGVWNQLSAVNVDCAAAGDIDADSSDEVVGDFGPAGLWLYNGGTWTQLSGVNADYMIITELGGGRGAIVGDFGTVGLWAWDAGAWTQLSGINADYMTYIETNLLPGDELLGDFAATGLWLYDSGLWTQLSGVNADYLLTADTNGSGTEEIIADFAATGLWFWDSGNWTQDSGVDPEYMINLSLVGSGGTACDFGALGIWLVGPGGWVQLSGVNPDYFFGADVDSDGSDEILADFGALGMWQWKWVGGAWSQISPLNAE